MSVAQPSGAGRVSPPRVAHLSQGLMRRVANDHGGAGGIDVYRAYGRADGARDVRFIDIVEVPPGSSIGIHRHGDDVETYILLGGRGTMTLDGVEVPVTAGDVVVNRPFGEHGLRNDSAVPIHLVVIETVSQATSPLRSEGPAA
jgi:mannose-6-phosphate isomerase-like protein (cupin superfamily)